MADELLHVSKILQAVGAREARRELQLDKIAERQDDDVLTSHADVRVGEADGLGLAVARIVARNEDVDFDVELGVAESVRAWEALHPPAAEMLRLEFGETCGREQDDDVR